MRLSAPARGCGGWSSCAASVRSRALLLVLPRRFGRWRCRWSAHPLVALVASRVAGIGRRTSRCRPSPGGWWSCALLGRARRARGCSTPGDDRLETRAYAVKRYLFRLGHAQRSARYATSVEQLVVGLAPVMGWGPVPRERAERARFVRAHRKSVQRWLDDLQAAGVVAHEPERDGAGSGGARRSCCSPRRSPTADELRWRAARARVAAPRARAPARGRAWRRAWPGSVARSGVPERAVARARLARARGAGWCTRRAGARRWRRRSPPRGACELLVEI